MTDGTWTGPGSNFPDTNNWFNMIVPGSTGTGLFSSSPSNQTVNISSLVKVGGLNITGGNYTFNVSGNTAELDLKQTGVKVTAGSATFNVTGGGQLVLFGQSDFGNAGCSVDNMSGVDVANATATVHFGSCTGGGTFVLNNTDMSMGGDNSSFVFAGDFVRTSLNSTGVVIKDGTGTFTFAGSDFGCPIDLSTGTLILASSGAAGAPSITFGNDTIPLHDDTLVIESTALDNGHFSPVISSFGPDDIIDIASLPFTPGEVYHVFFADNKVIVEGKGGTIAFDGFFLNESVKRESAAAHLSYNHLVALNDHNGGTELLAAIVATRPGELVDATHHPPGQPSPTNAPDVIVAQGANETIKGLGGDDILVARAPGVVLYGGPGADHFIIDTLRASPPSHRDQIADFHHSQGDKIDLLNLFGQAPVFIHGQTFAHYHHLHPHVFDMVRYASGVVEVNVNHNLAPDLAIVMRGAPALHASDFIL